MRRISFMVTAISVVMLVGSNSHAQQTGRSLGTWQADGKPVVVQAGQPAGATRQQVIVNPPPKAKGTDDKAEKSDSDTESPFHNFGLEVRPVWLGINDGDGQFGGANFFGAEGVINLDIEMTEKLFFHMEGTTGFFGGTGSPRFSFSDALGLQYRFKPTLSIAWLPQHRMIDTREDADNVHVILPGNFQFRLSKGGWQFAAIAGLGFALHPVQEAQLLQAAGETQWPSDDPHNVYDVAGTAAVTVGYRFGGN